jgi:hypothetical protein
MWLAPQSVQETARDCSITINMKTVHQLREELGGVEARDAAFRFVDPEFQADADEAYVELGCPDITLLSAWDIFIAVADILNRGV